MKQAIFFFSASSILSKASDDLSRYNVFKILRRFNRCFSFIAAADPSFKSETSSSTVFMLSSQVTALNELSSWVSLTNWHPAIIITHSRVQIQRKKRKPVVSHTSRFALTIRSIRIHRSRFAFIEYLFENVLINSLTGLVRIAIKQRNKL